MSCERDTSHAWSRTHGKISRASPRHAVHEVTVSAADVSAVVACSWTLSRVSSIVVRGHKLCGCPAGRRANRALGATRCHGSPLPAHWSSPSPPPCLPLWRVTKPSGTSAAVTCATGAALEIDTVMADAEAIPTAHRRTAHAVVMAGPRQRAETFLRLCGAGALCLAAVLVTAALVGTEEGGAHRAAGRDALLSAKSSGNYYVDARIAQHREERMQEIGELRREDEEKRERKAALEAQEARQVRDEDAMANKALERYNDIYTASTPEEAALDSRSDTVSGSAQEDAQLDQRFDQYDSPALHAGARRAAATVKTQNLAAAKRARNIQGLVRDASHDLEALEDRLEHSSNMMRQRGSTQLKDILDSSMLEMKGLAKRVGVRVNGDATPASPQLVVAAPMRQQMAAAPASAAVPTASVEHSEQAADDKKIGQEGQYPSMQSMIEKYKAWMAAKREVEETGRALAGSVSTQGLSSVPLGQTGQAALASAPGPCADINRVHAGDTAARENACAHTHACHYDFGYQLCLQKQ